MGGGASRFNILNKSPVKSGTNVISPTNAEGSLSLIELEFKSRLSNGVVLKYLSEYSKLINRHYFIAIWESIQNYLSFSYDSPDVLDTLCLMLFPRQDYFPMAIEFIQACKAANEKGRDFLPLRNMLLDQIQTSCFHLIYEHIYKPFTTTTEYVSMCEYIDYPFKSVTVDSFQYLNVLAQGGFGVVIQCRHIPSKVLYAMKIQSKVQLLRQFYKDKERLTREMAANVVFNHPYISGIMFAFQTQTLTMLVSPISACGDLRRSLNLCPSKRMSLDRVTFYSAEISAALMYMHLHDIMYRDLKPANVLLNADGHVMLADFGSLTGDSNNCM